MRALWKSDLGQGKHDPLEIVSVVTKSGSTISAALLVPLGDELVEYSQDQLDALRKSVAPDETAGLLEVIDVQLAAIDELSNQLQAEQSASNWQRSPEHEALKEWADQFPDLVEDLCMALGFARNPVAPTGIPELDILVKLSK